MRRSTFLTFIAAVSTTPFALAQMTQRQVTLVVPYAPGGGYDRIARIVAPRLAKALNQSVIVENRGGAGGTLGMAHVARATPDGTTLVVAGPGDMGISPFLYDNLSYNTTRDFVPITMLARFSLVLITSAKLPARSVPELLQLVKDRGTPVTCAIASVGAPGHLSAEMFRRASSIPMTTVPYKGTSPALRDLAAGHVEMMFTDLGSVLPLVRAGKLNALAVTTENRLAVLPHVPTMIESGLPTFKVTGWWGLLAPAGTPAAIVQEYNRHLAVILNHPDVQKEIVDSHAEPGGVAGDAFARVVQEDIVKFERAVKDAGIKLN